MPRTHDSLHATQHQPSSNNLTEELIDLQGFQNLPHITLGAPSNFAAASSSFDTAAAVRKELLDAWTAQWAQNIIGQQGSPPMRLNGLSAQMVASMIGACTHPAALAQNPQRAADLAQTLALQAAEQTSQRVAELAARQAVIHAAQQVLQQQHVTQMIAQLSQMQQAAWTHTSTEMPVEVLISSLKYLSTRMCLCTALKCEPIAISQPRSVVLHLQLSHQPCIEFVRKGRS